MTAAAIIAALLFGIAAILFALAYWDGNWRR